MNQELCYIEPSTQEQIHSTKGEWEGNWFRIKNQECSVHILQTTLNRHGAKTKNIEKEVYNRDVHGNINDTYHINMKKLKGNIPHTTNKGHSRNI